MTVGLLTWIMIMLSLKVMAQDTSPITEATTGATSGSFSGSTLPPTAEGANTTSAATTVLATCRPRLNLSPSLSPFWVKTVLLSVPASVDVRSCSWLDHMETQLLQLLLEGRSLSTGKRKKRYASSGGLQLQLVSASRDTGSERVTLLYYVLLSGSSTYMEAGTVSSGINAVAVRAAAVLGYSVETVAAVYDTAATQSTSKLWIIGAVFGSLAAILLIVWAVLFTYHKCLRPYEAPKYTPAGPMMDEYRFTDEAGYRPVDAVAVLPQLQTSHAASNPWTEPSFMAAKRSGYSSAEIDELAEQVAMRLDSHVTQMLDRRTVTHHQPPPEGSSGDDEEQQETVHRATVHAQKSAAFKADSDESVEESVSPRRRQMAVHASPQRGLDRDGKPVRRHQDAERKRNKDRLRMRAIADAKVGPATGERAVALDEVDGIQSKQPEVGPQQQQTISDVFDLDPAIVLPVPCAPDPVPLLPVLSRPPLVLRKSPYSTGDEVARILPFLETDLEMHYNLRQDEQLEAAQHHRQLTLAAQHREAASRDQQPAAASRVITVEPKSATSPASSLSAGNGGSVVMVRPASKNQDEWDVIRDCALSSSNGGSGEPKVPLAVLRREVLSLRDAAGGSASTSSHA